MTFDAKALPAVRQQAVAQLVAELSADTQPILCGPWRSELGFEILYWEPFLRYLATVVSKFDTRAAIVTRGGMAPLYAAVASQGVDLYTLRSVTEVRRENLYDHRITSGGKTQKQLVETAWDREVIADAADQLKLALPYHVVHPSWMYWACAPYWEEDAGLRYLSSLSQYVPLAKPALPADCPLPPRYVAVKFYGRSTWPYPHPDISEVMQQVTGTIAAQTSVVLLSSGNEFDDHLDVALEGPNITRLPPLPVEVNLAVQAAVVAHATAFVGTYGGMAQLALRLGVPSASLYHEWKGTAHAHLSLSSWLSKASGVPFAVGSLTDVGLWKQLTSVSMRAIQQAQAAPTEAVSA